RANDLRIDQGFDVGEKGGELLRAAGTDVLPLDLSQGEGVQHEVQVSGRLFERGRLLGLNDEEAGSLPVSLLGRSLEPHKPDIRAQAERASQQILHLALRLVDLPEELAPVCVEVVVQHAFVPHHLHSVEDADYGSINADRTVVGVSTPDRDKGSETAKFANGAVFVLAAETGDPARLLDRLLGEIERLVT